MTTIWYLEYFRIEIFRILWKITHLYCSKLRHFDKILIDRSVDFVSMLLVSTAAFLYLHKYNSQKFVDYGRSQVLNFVSSAGHNFTTCCFIKTSDVSLISEGKMIVEKGVGYKMFDSCGVALQYTL